ncbi:TonB-dependent receptor [Alteromonas sp. M12]|uniref:TonB-dependent receptor n=1 Tax=Alteromonas sp. M12 TaxID=3135644 RepID=UPI00319E7C2A
MRDTSQLKPKIKPLAAIDKRRLGSSALMAALTFGSTLVYAEDTDTCKIEGKSEVECAKEAESLEKIKVHGVRHSIYNVKKSGDVRRVIDLADTPQTITVLTKDQILESGRTDLEQILSTQAGVTLGTGENGNAFGDRYVIRGHEARSDVFVDGLRDPGMTTRESFATDQIEITKGPSATFAGRGSSGGAVNSITKKADPSYNFGRVDAAIGTDEYHRITIDTNMAVSENLAFRINGLDAYEDAPGREGIVRNREGLLLSTTYLPTDKLSFSADAYYMQAEDVPDLGSYFDRVAREPVSDIPVYAQSEDFLDSEVYALTLFTNYEINDQWRIYNATRVGKTENGYLTTGASGSTRDETDPEAPNADTITLSTHQGNQEVDYVASQFNLFWNTKLLGVNHKVVFGFEYSDESVDNGVYNITYGNEGNCLVNGRNGVSSGYCALDGNGNVVSDVSNLMNRSYVEGDSDAVFDIQTTAFYVMDNIELNKQWELFIGLRQDSFDYSNDTNSRSGEQLFAYSDDLTNGHIGLVYQLDEDINFYSTYSTATNINGGESDLGANCGYGGLCGTPDQAQQSDPERIENIEVGTKWQFMDDELLATAAIFQITKSDVMESVGDAYSSLGSLNTGKNRVKGIEFGLTGEITEQLSVQFSAAFMDSEVLESFNDENIGRALSNFADNSYYVQLRYQPTESFVVGGDYTYKSEMYGGQPDTAAGYDDDIGAYSIVVPSYSVVNLFANYYVSEDLTLRLNVGNLLDEEYWTAAYRSGSFMYIGDGRSVRAGLTYEF